MHPLHRALVLTAIAAGLILMLSSYCALVLPHSDFMHKVARTTHLQLQQLVPYGSYSNKTKPRDINTRGAHSLQDDVSKRNIKKRDTVFSQYRYGKIPIHFPVESMVPLPSGEPKPLPKIQHDFEKEDAEAKSKRELRRDEVKKTFLRGWKNYRERAYPHDELYPISGGKKDLKELGGWAATMFDSLDTLWVMGLEEEFTWAVKEAEHIDFGKAPKQHFSTIQVTIRHLGGLLAAYDLSGEEVLLTKAKEVGELLYGAFDTPNRMPQAIYNPHEAANGTVNTAERLEYLDEIGSYTLEFTRLSQLTKDPKWYDAIVRITECFAKDQDKTSVPGLWSKHINPLDRAWDIGASFVMGINTDTAYEYLPKTFMLLGGLETVYKSMFVKAMEAAVSYLLFRPMNPVSPDFLIPGQYFEWKTVYGRETPHQGCFAGAMFALGGKIFDNKEYLKFGRQITDTCIWAYKSSNSGIMPHNMRMHRCGDSYHCPWDEEVWERDAWIFENNPDWRGPWEKHHWEEEKPYSTSWPNTNMFLKPPEGLVYDMGGNYRLKPEAIESVFTLYRITGDQQFQDAAWDMFTAIENQTKTEYGNAYINDARLSKSDKEDQMNSYWLAETLKYFYLVFSEPDLISLDDYVFNAEGHPFKLPKPNATLE